MQTRYFVKFIGDKHVTVAKAQNPYQAEILLNNQYEETTLAFYTWVQQNTRQVGQPA